MAGRVYCCSRIMVKQRKNLFDFKFFMCSIIFPARKSLPVLLCILGAGHLLIYFAVRNVKYGEGNPNKPRIPAPETTQNHTEREG